MPENIESAWIELLTRVLCDFHPPASDGAYLFAQTLDNQQSALSVGLRLVKSRGIPKILISGSSPTVGFPGFEVWSRWLCGRGLRGDILQAVPYDDVTDLNTLTEAKSLVRYADQVGLRTLYLVASPFHQLRAFVTTVTAILRHGSQLRAYNAVGDTLPWSETVIHSQGILRCPRRQAILTEWERLKRYRLQGDLASGAEILDYLDARER